MTGGSRHPAPRTPWLAAVDVGAWTVIAAVTASDVYLSGGAGLYGIPGGSWIAHFLFHLAFWSPWALMTPLAFRLARQYPIRGNDWWRPLVVQAVFSIAWVLLYSPVSVGVMLVFRGEPGGLFATRVRQVMSFRLYVDLFLTWVVTVIAYASTYYVGYLERERESAELKEQLTRAELEALRSRLHPHFLFNALNSVSGLIRGDDRETALRVIAGLSDLLRYVLETESKPLVSLRSELEFVRTFLMIQQVRFGERLRVDYDVDPACLEHRVPASSCSRSSRTRSVTELRGRGNTGSR